MADRRALMRFPDVRFEIVRGDGTRVEAFATDASQHCARFRASDRALFRGNEHGQFELSGHSFQFRSARHLGYRQSAEGFVVEYETQHTQSQQSAAPTSEADASLKANPAISQSEIQFLRAEAAFYAERHRGLESKNTANLQSIIQVYTVLMVFAAAPFTLQKLEPSAGFFRAWGLGGVWMALAAWFHADRTLRAYGKHMFEKAFCLRQLASIRRAALRSSISYQNCSVLPLNFERYIARDRTGDPYHISADHVRLSAYFYKIVSIFPPLYLLLFINLLALPAAFLSGQQKQFDPFAIFQVTLASSGVLLFWAYSSTKRCFELLKDAYRARRISRENFWPLFPVAEHKQEFSEWLRVMKIIAVFSIVISSADLTALLLPSPPKGISVPGMIAIILTVGTGLALLLQLFIGDLFVRSSMKWAKRWLPTGNVQRVEA